MYKNFNNPNINTLNIGQKYTILLFLTSLLGVHIIGVNLGNFVLSPYRLLLLFSPFFLLFFSKETKLEYKSSDFKEYYNFLIIWVLYSILSLAWVNDFTSWSRIFVFLLSGCITSFLLVINIRKITHLKTVFNTIEIFSVFVSIIAIYEIFTGSYLFINNSDNLDFYANESLMSSSIGLRVPISLFGNPNHFAVFLLFALANSFILFKIKTKKRSRLFSLICFLLFIILILTTQSRASFLGLSLFLFFILYNKVGIRQILGVFVLLIIIFLIYSTTSLLSFIDPLIQININEVGSDIIRNNLIKNGLYFLKGTFYFGVGLGNIEYYMINHGIYYTKGITNIHNWWLEILVSSGVFVFIYYLKVYFNSLNRLYSLINSKNYIIKSISKVYFALLISLIISSIGPSTLLISEWFLPLFSLIILFINCNKSL